MTADTLAFAGLRVVEDDSMLPGTFKLCSAAASTGCGTMPNHRKEMDMHEQVESKAINGADHGGPRPSVLGEAIKSGPERTGGPVREERPLKAVKAQQKPAKRRRFTVIFYCLSSEPNSLPSFAYAVAGTVLGHTKFLAYMEAEDPQQASYQINAFFDVAQIESVADDWQSMQDAPLRGTVASATPRGWFSRLFGG